MRASSATRRTRVIAFGTAALLFLLLVVTSFDSSVQEVQREVVGDAGPFGMSPTACFIAAQAALFLPVPWIFLHGAEVIEHARQQGYPVRGLVTLVGGAWAATRAGGSPARSGWVVFGGLGYFAALLGAWIAFTAYRGI